MDKYQYTMTNFKVPDQAEPPPEPTAEEFDRNVRNSCRQEAIEALNVALSRLEELEDYPGDEITIVNLIDDLHMDMED